MIPKGLFTQIVMIAVAIGIIVTFVRPEFSRISEVQDDISDYQAEKEKVADVNERLTDLVNALQSVPATEQARLLTYLPDEVDKINVPRILQFIAEETGIIFSQVAYGGTANDKNDKNTDIASKHLFSFSAEGTYGQIKDMLSALEENEFPLEVNILGLRAIDGDFLRAEVTVATYSLQGDVIE